ncbi:MAG TPA: D-glycero-beta-D-manno-heptose 1,7-bisphosphate 7-phosphatase [Gammaproteobacteria bacterium]|nr:D-glycero-beta-D-manno-heptose 1,7-bisphosphate 7-phosphatase [Gammaproteobacteria bacterium]
MPLIILDRDGVINHESHAYIKSPEEWLPIPGSLQAIAKLNQAGFEVIIATNQSGLARGLFDQTMLELIHDKLNRSLAAEGGKIKDIFYCPHHPEDKCGCRKPMPGLFTQIKQKYQVNLAEVYFVGDSYTDILAATNAGCKPILVLTGNGQQALADYQDISNVLHFNDLAHAAEYIIHEKNIFTP